ncbi:MAG TPA: transcription antitermination factor NusB [Aestuariivirgaceae bacterium]
MGIALQRSPPDSESSLIARAEAARLLHAILKRGIPLDEAFGASLDEGALARVPPRDRRLCHAIIATTLRRKGQIDRELRDLLAKPLPKSAGLAPEILAITAAQILFMRIPPHAAVAEAVRMAKADNRAQHFAGVVNAVGRRLASLPPGETNPEDLSINTPAWLFERWARTYGRPTASEIARAHLSEAPLDITVRGDAILWAERLDGEHAGGQTIRLRNPHGAIADLPGFTDGQWWIQDEAASWPAGLLGPVQGRRVLDLCAAPGGKTAQLASAGAHVTAVDRSPARLDLLRQNMERLKLHADLVLSDVLRYEPSSLFDAVLVDAPCFATGIIRRHPDIPYQRHSDQLLALTDIQRRMLRKAATLVPSGGTVVFCTCSIEPEEGEHHLDHLPSDLKLWPLSSQDSPIPRRFIDSKGCMRSRPDQGLDGFFAMRLERL